MYEEHIRAAARSMAENMQRSPVPMYGKGLRLPDKGAVIGLLKEIRRLVFPAYYGDPELMTLPVEDYTALLLERIEGQLARQIALALPEEQEQRASVLAREVVEALPGVQRLLLTDLDATFESDPAAASKEEILFAYPGLFAIFVYRVAHELYLRQIPMIPRIMSEYAHSRTGIDIHPGAQIGAHFFIDHGTGIVVGETTVIGENVKLYQGVTLGGTGKEHGKRHPTIGNNVMISAGAKVLGSFTIGDNSKIGAGSVVLSEVPPGSTVVGVPGRVVKRNNASLPQETMNQTDLPDPVREDITVLQRENSELTNRVLEMEDELKQLRRLVVMSAETGEQPQSAENDKTV